MQREEAKEYIKANVSCLEYLTKSKGKLYCCPFCGSGTGRNKTGALQYFADTNRVNCNACGKNTDVIELVMQKNGSSYNEAFSLLADRLNITIETDHIADGYQAHKQTRATAGQTAAQSPATDTDRQTDGGNAAGAQEGTQGAKLNFAEYYKECAARIADPAAVSYLNGRGISLETAKRCGVGYDPAADPANAPGESGKGPHPCPRIILPTTSSHYVARSIDPHTPDDFIKLNPSRAKGAGGPGLFNGSVLRSEEATVIFLAEGPFDALAIIEAGADAIAINGAGNAKKFIEHLEKHPTAASVAFVICQDNDNAGKAATDTLQAGLTKQNIPCIVADICGGAKDPNAALVTDRAAFTAAINEAWKKAATRPDSAAYYIDYLMAADMEKQKNIIKTGFSDFDKKFGGLYPGLYAFMAVSSLGKTTFCSQMADQIAELGNDVLFFSMEMSRLEMITKSINRYAAKMDPKSGLNGLKIRRNQMTAEQRELAAAAAKEYKAAVSDRVSIIEGDFNCNIPFIGNYIRQYIERNKVRPVVFIDYLQIIDPGESQSKKQQIKDTMDNAVKLFKQLTRELSIPIFVISSVNRASYLYPLDLESLKESGGIEYTADVVLGLQLQIMKDPIFEDEKKITERRRLVKEAKAKNPRELELVCLKNRYGQMDINCNMLYYPAQDLYREENGAPFEDPAAKNYRERYKQSKTSRI